MPGDVTVYTVTSTSYVHSVDQLEIAPDPPQISQVSLESGDLPYLDIAPSTSSPTDSSISSIISTGHSISSVNVVDSEEIRERRCCWNACHVRTGTVVIALFEILLLFHALIFVTVNLAMGESKYAFYEPDFAQVIKFEYFVPWIVLMPFWVIGNILSVIAVKTVFPLLMTVQLLLRIPPVSTTVIMAILFVINASHLKWPEETSVNWALIITLTLFIVATVTSIYFSYVMWACLKYLKYSRTVIVAQKFWTESTNLVHSSAESLRSSHDATLIAQSHLKNTVPVTNHV